MNIDIDLQIEQVCHQDHLEARSLVDTHRDGEQVQDQDHQALHEETLKIWFIKRQQLYHFPRLGESAPLLVE